MFNLSVPPQTASMVKIDWISFTLETGAGDETQSHELPRLIGDALGTRCDDPISLLGLDTPMTPVAGRAPYRSGWNFPQAGVTIYYNLLIPHFLVEISGRGCERLIDKQWINVVLDCYGDRLTRLDVACDFASNTRPLEFGQARNLKAFRSYSEVHSSTGDTYYVGSRESDRYARVYRYNEPHERAHLLRVEMVLKKKNARLAAQSILADGLEHYSATLGKSFGWSHHDWTSRVQATEKAMAWRPERHMGKTLFWLNGQVAPALRKMQKDGTLDVIQWFEENVIRPLSSDNS